jgi:hypothetical protein
MVSAGGRWEREEKICKILSCTGARVPSLSLSQIRKFSKQGMAGVMLGVMLVIYHALVLDTREKNFVLRRKKEKKIKKEKAHMK